MRFHLLGLADYPCKSTSDYGFEPTSFHSLCYDMALMIKRAGHELVFYGPESSSPPCDENVVVSPTPTACKAYQPDNPNWKEFQKNGRVELAKRYKPEDITLMSMGWLQSFGQELSKRSCEFAVGYQGHFARRCVFPSYAWLHASGRRPSSLDTVIPHFLNKDDWTFNDKPSDYILFIGRLGVSKGEFLLGEIAARTGAKIIAAGVGSPQFLTSSVEYVGQASHEERLALISNAKAVIMPTQYIEPFGMVAIEALACGTPVIGSDWGAFTEILTPDVGYRCRSMNDWCEAVKHVGDMDRNACRQRFLDNYSLEAVWPQYEAYFKSID